MNEMCDSQDFWIDLVEESIELDWSKAYVPVDRLPVNVAMALAERLNMEIEIDATEYVFSQAGKPASNARPGRVLH